MSKNEYIVGVDVGTRMTKCVLFDANGGGLVSRVIMNSGSNLARIAEVAIDKVCENTGVTRANIVYTAATGYGRYQVANRQIQITEISCHAMGAKWLFPNAVATLDVGAQNAKAMKMNDEGRVTKFKMNDKCASGAGRFLERVAKGLELELDEIGALSLRSKNPQIISSICAVLAESEVINLVTTGYPVEDILMGAHLSISERIVALLRQVGSDGEVALTGGITRNAGMVKALQTRLGKELHVNTESEYAGAIGACLLAKRRIARLRDASATN